jgi:uroporphyrinogen-III synthase
MGPGSLKVVLTREAGRNESLEDWLPEDASFTEVPLTRTRYYELPHVMDALAKSDSRGRFESLVVTSERSHNYATLAIDASAADVEVFSVGPATTAALEGHGVNVHRQGDGGALTLAPHIVRGPVLVLGARELQSDLVEVLRERDLDVSVVACYETVALVPSDAEQALLGAADVVFIGAPSAWAVARAFVAPRAWIVVPGASTGAVVAVEHERVMEGWGPHLRQRLANVE